MATAAKTTVHRLKTGARQGAAVAKRRRQKPPGLPKKKAIPYLNKAAEGLRQLLATAASPFAFNGQAVRVVDHDGQPWFASADVCALLEIRNSRQAVARLDDDEKGVTTIDTAGGQQTMGIVNESGLYRLIFKSRKPQARAFRRWVTSEVLPSIRKTGSYRAVAADGPDEIRPLQVELPSPGRYVIMAIPGQAAHVRRTEYDAMVIEFDALDRQLMACALTTTAAYWHKVQQLRAIGAGEIEGDMLQRLERAILDGSTLGADCLRVLSMARGQG